MQPLHVSRGAASAARQYVMTRARRQQVISTSQAVRALRMVLPDCALSDRELADLVAEAAIAHGVSVSFDGDGDSTPRPDAA
ncbi:hypothetical protein N1F89_06335 [Aquibium sp. A9E412]|uniref:hypothetical protein n=1 Tax=Aquibium sp. A9E412 TaxID=2976767 RepID=UPI0025AF852C|nr:hypothetical protein [Aquibium sp. A9E412]MDN2565832.1 hypothetical protein [Aquibium sp. A9E412]